MLGPQLSVVGARVVQDADDAVHRDEALDARDIASIDDRITRHAEHWKIPRMPAVDRNILRLSVYEMLHTETPAAVAIDEALELARRFSGEESVHFVNGVLDAVRRELTAVMPNAAT